MEYGSAIKRKRILTQATTWTNLEDITLSETSQTQKDKSCGTSLPQGPQSCQIHRDRKQSGGTRVWEEVAGNGKLLFNGVSMKKFRRWRVVMVVQRCEYP